ncbi:Protein PIN-LIKES 3 [Glycine max]|nr:Protein PIN-LIKES 3 [Glycine max]
MTKPPKRMEGLILGCCSARNLGSLTMIIIPAICKQKGSPFGEPGLCNQIWYGLCCSFYGVFLWSYVYNIMRISSSRIQKDNTSKDSNMLKASADISESHPHNFSETLYPTKDTMDDAYTILLPETNSEEKVSFPSKIKHCLRMISRNLNFKSMFAPSTLGAIAGFIIGVVPQIRNFIIGNNVPLHVVEDSSFHVGVCIP